MRHEAFFEKVTAHLPITKALLGDEVHKVFVEILWIRNEIVSALEERYNRADEYERENNLTEIRERGNALRRIIQGISDDKDEFYQKYKTALKALEDKLLPMISSA